MSKYNVFDVSGPIMIGPSSSHTAGACKIGLMSYNLIGKAEIKEVKFYLHGSFATTYKGHGTDKAVLGGLLSYNTYDEEIKTSFDIAKRRGINFEFIPCDLGDFHPNTVKLDILTKEDLTYEIIGSSIGGGKMFIVNIDNFKTNFNGDVPIVIIYSDIDIKEKVDEIFLKNNIVFNGLDLGYKKSKNLYVIYKELFKSVNNNIDDVIDDIKKIKGIKNINLLKSL